MPPSVDVRHWYEPMPLPGESVAPDAVSGTEALFCQLAEPPVTTGSLGGPRSIRMAPPPVPAEGVQTETLPAPSIEWNWTSVSPWPLSV